MAYLSQAVSVVFPRFIRNSPRCKFNRVQSVHRRNVGLFASLQVNAVADATTCRGDGVTHTWRITVAVMCHCNLQRKGGLAHAGRTFHLFDSSGQVLHKKPPQVVECLQLPSLCKGKEKSTSQRNPGIFSRLWDFWLQPNTLMATLNLPLNGTDHSLF